MKLNKKKIKSLSTADKSLGLENTPKVGGAFKESLSVCIPITDDCPVPSFFGCPPFSHGSDDNFTC